MSIAFEPKRCPQCGAPIPAEAPQGLCPKCLLLQASAPTEASQGASARSAPPTREELAAAFPQLEILELIGQGGMGFVFKARQPKLDRFVALKILPQSLAADPAFAERFSREGRVLAKLNHPNIVTIHDFGQTNGFFYLLMEFVDGVNLRQAMKAGRFTAAQALAIVPKICEALQFAHNEGILHRDIKPENILLAPKGRVKIADFGIAKLVATKAGAVHLARSSTTLSPTGGEGRGEGEAPALTGTGKALGTPQYMAPEQLEHPQDVDQRADIYSLGVVFYEMLTGELPVGRFAPPSEKSGADPRVDEVVLRALEKERERRQHSAGEVKTQVETIASTPGGVGATPKAQPSGSTMQRERAELSIAMAIEVACLATCLLLAARFPRQAAGLLIMAAWGGIALVLCGVAYAGYWPFASRRYPRPNFRSRKLLGANPPLEGQADADKFEIQNPKSKIESRFSRTAIVGVCWAPLFLLVALSFLSHYSVSVAPGVAQPGPAWWQILLLVTSLPLGLSAPFGTTILGWVAVGQIHRSAGKLYGMWLAVFDGLLFPLLVLGGLTIWFWHWVFYHVIRGAIVTSDPPHGPVARIFADHWEGFVALCSVATLALAGTAIIIVVWRAVNKGSAGVAPGSRQPNLDERADGATPSAARGTRALPEPRSSAQTKWRPIGLTAGLHAILLFVLTAVLVVVVPRFVALFAQLGTQLPPITRWVLGVASFVQHGGFLLIPFLLAVDVLVCWLAQKLGGRKLLGVWAVTGALGLGAVGIAVGSSMRLPMVSLAETRKDVVLKGTVTDAETGLPITGARVASIFFNRGSDRPVRVVWTDNEGRFAIKTWEEPQTVNASAEGHLASEAAFFRDSSSPSRAGVPTIELQQRPPLSVSRMITFAIKLHQRPPLVPAETKRPGVDAVAGLDQIREIQRLLALAWDQVNRRDPQIPSSLHALFSACNKFNDAVRDSDLELPFHFRTAVEQATPAATSLDFDQARQLIQGRLRTTAEENLLQQRERRLAAMLGAAAFGPVIELPAPTEDGFQQYPVQRTWADLGRQSDRSQPETASASFGVRLVDEREDPASVMAECVLDAPRLPAGSMQISLTPEDRQRVRNSRAEQVVIYRGALAGVFSLQRTNANDRYVTSVAGLRNGSWNEMVSVTEEYTNLDEAIRDFKAGAPGLLAKFQKLPDQPESVMAAAGRELAGNLGDMMNALVNTSTQITSQLPGMIGGMQKAVQDMQQPMDSQLNRANPATNAPAVKR